MAEDFDTLPERVDVIERELDSLSASVDERFDEIDEHFVEQRQYTKFACERLWTDMTAGTGRLEDRIGTVERTVGRLDCKLDQLLDRSLRHPPE